MRTPMRPVGGVSAAFQAIRAHGSWRSHRAEMLRIVRDKGVDDAESATVGTLPGTSDGVDAAITEQVVADSERVLGVDHHDTISALEQLATRRDDSSG